MWAVEGLTHRYPTKVLAELIPTCPQYCGHCTRMDLVGNDTTQVLKYKFEMKQNERWEAMLAYLRATPSVRDVVVSGGDMANVPIKRLQEWLFQLFDIENVRDVRIATKGLMGIPQHFLQDEVLAGYDAIAKRAHERGVEVAIHTHVNAAQQVTPLVGAAVGKLLDMGYRDVRNQGVLLRGVNTTPNQILELCFMLLDHAKVMPYYFYMCDMIPNAEHWRLAVWEAQELQFAVMGYLPGFATPTVRLRRPVRREALGAHGLRLRPHDGHLVLEEELPDRHRGRGPGRAHARVPVLRPDLDAPRGGEALLARVPRQGAGPDAPARLIRRGLSPCGPHRAQERPARAEVREAGAVRAVLAQRQDELLEPRALEVQRPRQRVGVRVALGHRIEAEEPLDEREHRGELVLRVVDVPPSAFSPRTVYGEMIMAGVLGPRPITSVIGGATGS